MARLQALAHPNFRRYFAGQAVSLVGGFAHQVALTWLAYRLTGSAAVLGLVGFASTAPTLVVSPLAGVLADRFPRRQLVMGVLAGVVLQCLVLSLLTWLDRISAAGLIAIALIRGTLFAIEIPVRHALLGELVDDKSALPNAVALHSSALNGARFVGPAIGGALVAWGSEIWCFLLNAATLSVALWQLSRIRTRHVPKPGHAGEPVLAQLRAGFRYTFAHPLIRALLTALFVVGLTIGPYSHLMPGAVADRFEARPELVGLFLSSAGVGALAAALMLASRRSTRGVDLVTVVASACSGLGLLAFSLSSWVPLSMLGIAMVGFGNIAQAAGSNMLIQQSAEDAMRGRVMALYTVMFIGAMPLGSLAIGLLAEAIGTARALTLAAILCLAGSVRHALGIRRLRRDGRVPGG